MGHKSTSLIKYSGLKQEISLTFGTLLRTLGSDISGNSQNNGWS